MGTTRTCFIQVGIFQIYRKAMKGRCSKELSRKQDHDTKQNALRKPHFRGDQSCSSRGIPVEGQSVLKAVGRQDDGQAKGEDRIGGHRVGKQIPRSEWGVAGEGGATRLMESVYSSNLKRNRTVDKGFATRVWDKGFKQRIQSAPIQELHNANLNWFQRS